MSNEKAVFDPSEDQARTLAAVLDAIVPPSSDGRLPGAGEVGLVDGIVEAVRQSPDLRAAIVQGLASLEELAGARGSGGFAALSKEDRARVLEELSASAPAFLPALTFQTYLRYYQHPRVLAGRGLEPRPPYPDGYELATGDLSLLDAVRRRPRMYREA